MKKNGRKLIAAATMVAVLFVMVVTVSYAWMTISQAPEANGIQISLGGGNGILIAPDQTEVANGNVYHYPGIFNAAINFNQHEQYDYLNTMAPLAPVSTADGLHWYIPTYYSANDTAVINGNAIAGQLKPYNDFTMDSQLAHANITDVNAAKQGNYAYLDFWVVSPADDYELRIARGDEDEGSFLIELMQPSEDGENSFTVSSGDIAASARVGFLVDQNRILDDTIMYYTASGNRPAEYTYLRGSYHEMGQPMKYSSEYNFTIYEPNGDLHPNGENGTYVETKPIGWNNGNAVLTDVSDRLTVQLTNSWYENQYGYFYERYTKGQSLSECVNKGAFIANTAELYSGMNNGTVSAESMTTVERAGATIDTCIAQLEKNVPQRIRMFVWIEGQDVDCIGSKGDISFTMGVEFAGSQIGTDGKSKQKDS